MAKVTVAGAERPDRTSMALDSLGTGYIAIGNNVGAAVGDNGVSDGHGVAADAHCVSSTLVCLFCECQ